MLAQRLSAKFFVTDPARVELSKFVPVFQRWIQRQMVEGMLIDVATYEHVYQGPGVLLIGDEGDYSLDERDGRPGSMYTRKRQMPATLAESARIASRLALIAAQKMLAEPTLKGIAFDYNEVQITLLDRLAAPNTPETLAAFKDELEGFAAELYAADGRIELAYTDPREPFSVRVLSATPVDADTLLQRLSAGETVSG